MKAGHLEKEMYAYFAQLSEAEKKSVVEMIKTFVHGKEEDNNITVEDYNREIAEAEAEIERGEYVDHDEVEHMAKGWLHGR